MVNRLLLLNKAFHKEFYTRNGLSHKSPVPMSVVPRDPRLQYEVTSANDKITMRSLVHSVHMSYNLLNFVRLSNRF